MHLRRPCDYASALYFSELGLSSIDEQLKSTMEEVFRVDILCINCQNMIRTDLVERHSQVCFVVLPSILAIESASALRMINLKVDKLKCALETLDSDDTRGLSAEDLKVVNRLIQLCIGLLMSESEKSVEVCRGVVKEISQALQDFPGSLQVLVYCERLKALAQDKVNELGLLEEPEDLETKLEQKRLEAERLREQVDFYRRQTSALQSQFAKRTLEVDSDLGEQQVSGRFTSESVERESETREELDDLLREQESQARQKSSEELQRYFYSQCLQIKLGFPARDPAQAISLSSLFQKAQTQKVPIEKWPEFIKEEMSHAPRPSFEH